MRCKNCGNDIIKPKMSSKQIVLAVFLCIFFTLIGILYAVVCRKTTCPACKKNIYIKESKN